MSASHEEPARARQFADSIASLDSSGLIAISRVADPQRSQPFRPLPKPTGRPPFRLSLERGLTARRVGAHPRGRAARLPHRRRYRGGEESAPQLIVAEHLGRDFMTPEVAARPAFLYHLGDVVYFFGQASEYYPQFYEPYIHYPAPIVAIPGNHDGDLPPRQRGHSLQAFVENFCAPRPARTEEAVDAGRDAMTQPNVYWTLDAPFATFIGLYTNVPEGGQLDDQQIAWLEGELRDAPTDKALLLAARHPCYSADRFHSGSAYLGGVLDAAMEKTGRAPDAIFAGHVHNYQRFTRTRSGRQIPYIVAGAGGYHNLHPVVDDGGEALVTPMAFAGPGVTFERYADSRHGFLRLEVTPRQLNGSYYTVPRPQEPRSAPAQRVDTFALDLARHRLL